MKQVIQSYRTGAIKLADAPIPMCAADKVLVKNAVSVISIGTERSMIELGKKSLLGKARTRPDLVKRLKEKIKNEGLMKALQEAFGRLDAPTALGYSSAGVVEEVGKNVHKFSPGDRVACMGAGFASHAEYIAVPEQLCAKIPEGVSFEEAAFGTLGTIVLHGIHKANIAFGERVAVVGLGLLGLLAVQTLKAYGCAVYGLDVNPAKVALAQKLGADFASTSTEEFKNKIEKLTNGHGADAVLVTASTESAAPVHLAVDIARYGGKIVVIGVADIHPLRHEMWQKEVEIIVSKAGGPGLFDPLYENKNIDYPIGYVRWTEGRNLEEFLRLLGEKSIDVKHLISHTFSIAEAESVYRNILGNKSGPYIGVLFTYPREEGFHTLHGPRAIPNPDARITNPDGKTLGIIGAGLFGKALFLPALKKITGVRLHTLATSGGANAYHIGRKYGFEHFTTDYQEILHDKDIHAVLILTPHRMHATMVAEALQAKKHVFVEKPLCVSEQELRDIMEVYQDLASSKTLPVLTVGYNRRFSPHASKIKAFLKDRRDPLVTHYRANVGYVPPEHWVHSEQEGGSRIIGEACHFVDFLQWVTGSNPVRVYAERVSGNNKTALNSDNVSITIKFEDGSVGNIVYTASGDRAFSREHCEIFSEGNTVSLTDFRKTEFYRNGRRQTFTTFNQELGHKEELTNFVEAVRGTIPPLLTPEEAFFSTLTTFKIVEALDTGKPQTIAL